jgi:hypothetical protein
MKRAGCSPHLHRFSEGFDTAGLKHATTLLEQLSNST